MITEIELISPRQIESIKRSNVPLIDVRRKEEWESTGIIPEVHLLTFFDKYGHYDLEEWLSEFKKIVPSEDHEFVLICAHANRTKTIGSYLIEKLGYKNAYHLEGGMSLWQKEGRETIPA